jgi:putative ABC transport system permease protein
MRFVTLIYRNVTRRRARTALTVCALSTAVAAVVALVGIANGFARSFQDVYRVHGVDLVVSRKGAADRLSSTMDESAAERIRDVAGVEKAAGLLLETMSLEEEGLYGVPTIGLRRDSWLLRDYRVASGRSLRTDDQKVLLVGVQLAERLGRGAGDTLVFFEEERFEIVGVFESYSAWENSSLVMPLDELQRLTDREAQVTYVNVVLDGVPDATRVEQAVRSIEALDDKLLAMPTGDFVKTDTRMRLAGAMAWLTSSVALLIGAIGMLNTMMTSVFERTREIGLLRSIGWRKSLIVRMILLEASLLSVAAAVLGSAAGILMTWAMSRAPAVAGTISPAIDVWVLGQGLLVAVVIGLLGAAYPAYRGARLVPTEALRHE